MKKLIFALAILLVFNCESEPLNLVEDSTTTPESFSKSGKINRDSTVNCDTYVMPVGVDRDFVISRLNSTDPLNDIYVSWSPLYKTILVSYLPWFEYNGFNYLDLVYTVSVYDSNGDYVFTSCVKAGFYVAYIPFKNPNYGEIYELKFDDYNEEVNLDFYFKPKRK